MSLTDDIKNEGLTSQVVRKITDLEEFVRKHKTVQHGGSTGSGGSWVIDSNTWTFSSADAPIYIVSVNADMTSTISVGMRIRLVHGAATKYFLVHAVGAFSGGVTLLTLYGGTTWTLSATAITATYYSSDKTPFGFPSDPSNWRVTFSDSASQSQAAPVGNTYYNVGSAQIVMPIGAWRTYFRVNVQFIITIVAVTNISLRALLSTVNNNVSDTELVCDSATAVAIQATGSTTRYTADLNNKIVVATAKTTYYLLGLVGVTSTSLTFRGDILPTTIFLESAYL